jgi:uncharacterized protein (DUF433 family)
MPPGLNGDNNILALYPDLDADDVREALLFAAEAACALSLRREPAREQAGY